MNEVWKKPPISLSSLSADGRPRGRHISWHLVDQKRIDVYADVIEDHQFIHIDPERAKRETPSARRGTRIFDDVAVEHHVL